MIAHLLNRKLDGFRPETTSDGAGGQIQTLVPLQAFALDAMVQQPSAQEQQVAHQWESRHTHNLFFNSDVDIRRNDRFQGIDENGELQHFRVMGVVRPSRPYVYTKGIATLIQHQLPEGS